MIQVACMKITSLGRKESFEGVMESILIGLSTATATKVAMLVMICNLIRETVVRFFNRLDSFQKQVGLGF